MITVYTLAYNEQLLIQFMIDHYRMRFPGCRIVVYDNMSTDNTVKIALANGCEVVPYDTNGQLQDRRYLKIKNNCWKKAKTDWVLICDLDELVDINEVELKKEEKRSVSMIRCKAYDMINMQDNVDIAGIEYGAPSPMPGKFCCFSKKLIREINYQPGCHECDPVGTIQYSKKTYKLYHYASINQQVTVKKFRVYKQRLSKKNLQNGWGLQYLMTSEEIAEEYAQERRRAKKVR